MRTTSRTGALSMASPYVSQHPWFGRGFGTFFPATYFFTDDQYLLSLMEIGVVGLLALLALFITGLVTAQKVRRATTDPEMRDLGQSLTATIAVAMVAFGTFDALSFNMAAGLSFLLLGCTGAALRLIRAQGPQADGHLARLPVVQPDPEPPAITHRSPPGASGALGGLAGIRAGRQSNGHLTEPAEKTPQQQPNGHLPKAAEGRPERPADPSHQEPAEAQVEKPADKYLGERADGQLEQRAGGRPAEPAEAWMRQTASPPWEDQPWPWGTGEELAGVRPEQPAPTQAEQPGTGVEGPAAAAWDPWRKLEPPVHQAAEAADGAAAEPAGQPAPEPEARADEPAAAAWYAWRKPEPPAEPAAAEAAGQPAATEDQPPAGPTGQATAAAPEQQEEPAEPAAEPAGERPEESTVPIPVIRD